VKFRLPHPIAVTRRIKLNSTAAIVVGFNQLIWSPPIGDLEDAGVDHSVSAQSPSVSLFSLAEMHLASANNAEAATARITKPHQRGICGLNRCHAASARSREPV
jgi:hypothetical protein